MELLQKYINAKNANKSDHKSYSAIPKFYHQPKADIAALDTSLLYKLRKEKLGKQVESVKQKILPPMELDAVKRAIQEFGNVENGLQVKVALSKIQEDRKALGNQVMSLTNEEEDEELRLKEMEDNIGKLENALAGPRINYEQYCDIAEDLSLTAILTPMAFVQFPKDIKGRIDGTALIQYIEQRNQLLEHYLTLSLYDPQCTGYLDKKRLEKFISDLILTMEGLKEISESFKPFYMMAACRHFFFHCDLNKNGKMQIKDILQSTSLKLLLCPPIALADDELGENWFSPTSAQKVYRQYMQLDKDKNGLLSSNEFLRFGKAKAFRNSKNENSNDLSTVFVERIFEECYTYPPNHEIDFNGFLDVVLAFKYIDTNIGKQFVFRLVDLQQCGSLDTYTIRYFLSKILERMTELGGDAGNIQNVHSEIVDMIKPADPEYITLEDVLSHESGGVFLRLLVDFNGYWAYEGRDTTSNVIVREPNWPWES